MVAKMSSNVSMARPPAMSQFRPLLLLAGPPGPPGPLVPPGGTAVLPGAVCAIVAAPMPVPVAAVGAVLFAPKATALAAAVPATPAAPMAAIFPLLRRCGERLTGCGSAWAAGTGIFPVLPVFLGESSIIFGPAPLTTPAA